MDISELLDAAKRKQGRYQDIADKLGVKPPRISEWKKGTCTPDTNQIALIAEMAGLPVLETVADVEQGLRPGTAQIWERVIARVKATGVIATLVLILGMLGAPEKANASNNLRALSKRVDIYIRASVQAIWAMLFGSRVRTT